MNRGKQRRLERQGWHAGTPAEFLSLSPEESSMVETRLALAEGIRQTRRRKGLTQTEAATQVGSSQSRVAKMEAGDSTVTIDLMVRTLLRLGASRREVARIISDGAAPGWTLG